MARKTIADVETVNVPQTVHELVTGHIHVAHIGVGLSFGEGAGGRPPQVSTCLQGVGYT